MIFKTPLNNIFSIKLNGRVIDLSTPIVMSIINATPDSFWSGSRRGSEKEIIESVSHALECGATILDIGGYSTRPNASDVSEEEEIKRVTNALSVIKNEFNTNDINISIDTFRSKVVTASLECWGNEVIVNDISGGTDDLNMLRTVADNNIPYIAMHKRGNPKTMGSLSVYEDDIVKEIISYFSERLEQFKIYGIDDVILDIGFGFAKNIEQNFELIRRYSEFSVMGMPTLAGVSRKRMVWQTLDIDVSEALNGTSLLNYRLLQGGASILRVHDPKEAMEAVKLYNIVG